MWEFGKTETLKKPGNLEKNRKEKLSGKYLKDENILKKSYNPEIIAKNPESGKKIRSENR